VGPSQNTVNIVLPSDTFPEEIMPSRLIQKICPSRKYRGILNCKIKANFFSLEEDNNIKEAKEMIRIAKENCKC